MFPRQLQALPCLELLTKQLCFSKQTNVQRVKGSEGNYWKEISP